MTARAGNTLLVRAGLAYKVLSSTLESWFGKPARQIHDADAERYMACRRVAARLL